MKRLDENVSVETKVFKDKSFNSLYLDIEGSKITAKEGFIWDGCTCAKDQPRNRVACCIHDALLYAFRNFSNFPITRWQVDKVFFELLKESRFKLGGWIPFSPHIYYIGVSLNTLRKSVFK